VSTIKRTKRTSDRNDLVSRIEKIEARNLKSRLDAGEHYVSASHLRGGLGRATKDQAGPLLARIERHDRLAATAERTVRRREALLKRLGKALAELDTLPMAFLEDPSVVIR
jgi:hypothetical protein